MGDDEFLAYDYGADTPELSEREMRKLFGTSSSPTGRFKDQPIMQTSHPASMQQSNQLKRMGHRVGANNMGRPTPDLRELDELLHQARGGAIVVWTSNHRFTYAAVHAAGKWFITGRGDYYGGNEFTHQQFVYQVLGHHDVTSIYLTTDVQTLFTR